MISSIYPLAGSPLLSYRIYDIFSVAMAGYPVNIISCPSLVFIIFSADLWAQSSQTTRKDSDDIRDQIDY